LTRRLFIPGIVAAALAESLDIVFHSPGSHHSSE